MQILTPAAERLLSSASALFAREGIRGVGIDRILAEAGVAKATLYQAFGSKEALVVAHLERRDAADRQAYRARLASAPPGPARVLASFDLGAKSAATGGFLGCLYVNAMSEFPEPDQPIARAVRQHRDWVQEQWLEALGPHPEAPRIVEEVQIAYDGALLGSKIAHSAEPIELAREIVRARLALAGFDV